MSINAELLEILVCPRCKGEIVQRDQDGQSYLDCNACELAFPVEDGIPVMLVEEAESLRSEVPGA